MKTGLNITVFTTKEELLNAKAGSTTMIASKAKTKEADFQLIVSLDACDILDGEIRINLSLIRNGLEDVGRIMGEAMGSELQRIIQSLG